MKKIIALLGLMLSLCSAVVHGAGFEVAVSPSRYELTSKQGQRIGQTLSIYNLGATPADISVRTLDWTYSADGGIAYIDELVKDSCRPWVTLERRLLRVPAKSQYSFRFQVEVPPETPRRECRLMLALEGIEPAHQAVIQSGAANLNLPVNGRLAVAVYLMVGGAEPALEVLGTGVQEIRGVRTPVITVINKGDAHGRLEGSLDAVDAKGLQYEVLPEGTPIMPGQTRTLPFSIRTEANKKPPEFLFPIKTSGVIDWDKGSFKINMEFK